MRTKTYLLLLCLAGCGVSVETQPQRFDYLKDKTEEDIKKYTQCEDAKLTFRESNRVGTTWYDTYTLEGCGQKTDYITGLTRTGDWITWKYGVAPQPEQLRQAAKDQLAKTAEFDLDCKSPLDFTILNEVFDPMHVALVASVGVRGCDKQSTYRTSCGNTDYQKGKHVITCTSVVTSATSK